MTNVIIALPKQQDAIGIRNILVRNGFSVVGICTTGAQAISLADDLNDGIIVCSYKLLDMIYSELYECLPKGFEMLIIASDHLINECRGSGIMCLSMPLKVGDLIDTVSMMSEGIVRRRKKARLQPKTRSAEEEAAIAEAKELLMGRNHMSEEEAHKYLQKCSMESGTNIVDMALMVLAMMK